MVCLRRTALCVFWDAYYQGGTDPYLSETHELELIELCLDSATQFECLTTFDITEAARALKDHRVPTAIRELTEMDCPRLAQTISTEVQPPSRSWVNDLCQRHVVLALLDSMSLFTPIMFRTRGVISPSSTFR